MKNVNVERIKCDRSCRIYGEGTKIQRELEKEEQRRRGRKIVYVHAGW